MLWEDYYDKLGDWATSTAVSRISQLESFGPPDELVDAINQIGYDDEKGATRLLKKAISAGVKFTGDQLSELVLICDEEVLNHAIQFSSDQFGTDDLDALYGFRDAEVLIHIAEKQQIPLPDVLADFAAAITYDPEEDACVDPPLTPAELIGEYDYILDCLARAHEYLRQAYRLSLIDAARKHRGATVLKYAQLVDAQPYISNAVAAWKQLKIPDKDADLLRDISPDISNSTMWQNYLFEGFFTNLIVKKRIHRVMKNLEHDYKVIQKLRNALCADITGMTEADKHGP